MSVMVLYIYIYDIYIYISVMRNIYVSNGLYIYIYMTG